MKNTNPPADEDLIESINLTTKLQQSLKKLLTSKKKHSQCNHPHLTHQEHQRIIGQMQVLRQQKQQLVNDNQLLSRQLILYKQQTRELNKEVKELKKYISFLQGYNSTLKKEMAYWVKKPRGPHQLYPDPMPNYHLLNQEIDTLKQMNNLRQKQIHELNGTIEAKVGSDSVMDLHSFKSTEISKKIHKKSFNFSKNEENVCTSCSYSKLKSKKASTKHNSSISKAKHLCPCHKSYIETSDFLY